MEGEGREKKRGKRRRKEGMAKGRERKGRDAEDREIQRFIDRFIFRDLMSGRIIY